MCLGVDFPLCVLTSLCVWVTSLCVCDFSSCLFWPPFVPVFWPLCVCYPPPPPTHLWVSVDLSGSVLTSLCACVDPPLSVTSLCVCVDLPLCLYSDLPLQVHVDLPLSLCVDLSECPHLLSYVCWPPLVSVLTSLRLLTSLCVCVCLWDREREREMTTLCFCYVDLPLCLFAGHCTDRHWQPPERGTYTCWPGLLPPVPQRAAVDTDSSVLGPPRTGCQLEQVTVIMATAQLGV